MEIGQKVNYFGKEAEVVDKNLTHVLIKFVDGSKLCTTKTTFNKDYK
jgi:hypothetical protein